MNSSWADKTQASYKCQIKKWETYCKQKQVDPYSASFHLGVEFLADMFENNAKHGSIATARSALSTLLPTVNGCTFGKDPMVKRLMKGVFKRRPSLPKHTVIYDANVVLAYIQTLPPNKELSLEMLTKKLCTLLCLLSGQRSQAIPVLNIGYMHNDESTYTF